MARSRYLSLDILRGMTVALMILVNNPGSWATIYAPFKHAAWHGFTLTDLVFPTFLFVVGNAMSFSFKKMNSWSTPEFLTKTFKRAAIIFLIGLGLSYYPFVRRTDGEFILKNILDIRIMGVLQRIAVCYLLAAIAIRFLKKKWLVVLSVFILLLYWFLLWYFGGSAPYSLEANAALKFDLLVFNEENLYHGFGIPFDPEGLLSCLPAVVNVIFGYLAGRFIQQSVNKKKLVIQLVIAGLAMISLALVWDVILPVNKPIWTSSYVILSTGWDFIILGALIGILEIAEFKSWSRFFEPFGKNPLFIFVLSGVVVLTMGLIFIGDTSLKGWIYQNVFLSWLSPYNASLLYALLFLILMWLIAYILDKKKIRINGIVADNISVDSGQSGLGDDGKLNVNSFYAHVRLMQRGLIFVENATNLGQLALAKPGSCTLVVGALKHVGGAGGPSRVMALCEQ